MNIAGLKTSKMFTLTATVAELIPIVLFSLFAIFFISGGVSKTSLLSFNWKVEQTSSVLFLVRPSTSSTVSSDLKPCLSCGNAQPWKSVPRSAYWVLSVSVLYMLIIAGTIAMLGGRIMQTGTGTRHLSKWLALSELHSFLTEPSFQSPVHKHRWIHHGPHVWCRISNWKLLPEGLGKTNSKECPCHCIIISEYLRFLLLLSGSFEKH